MRPIIGISTYRQVATWGQWDNRDATLLPATYAEAVTAGGATPVLLPPYGIADDILGVVSRLDGLDHRRWIGRQPVAVRPRPGADDRRLA